MEKQTKVNVYERRQEWLFNYLCQFAISEPSRWLSEQEICEAYDKDHPQKSHYDYHFNANNPKGSCCSMIFWDMDELNCNMAVHKIIITKDRKFKISTSKEETETYYLNGVIRKLKNASHRKSLIIKKMQMDGQMTLDGEVVDVYGDEAM